MLKIVEHDGEGFVEFSVLIAQSFCEPKTTGKKPINLRKQQQFLHPFIHVVVSLSFLWRIFRKTNCLPDFASCQLHDLGHLPGPRLPHMGNGVNAARTWPSERAWLESLCMGSSTHVAFCNGHNATQASLACFLLAPWLFSHLLPFSYHHPNLFHFPLLCFFRSQSTT